MIRNCLVVIITVIVMNIGVNSGKASSLSPTMNKRHLALGPLTVHPLNPRYFTDGSGRAVYLTGSHTWHNFHDIGESGEFPFDYGEYLDFLERYNHNFFRLWTVEHSTWIPISYKKITFQPLPYLRVGPGKALDGGPKFSLTKFDQSYFDRLRTRVMLAQQRGIYVSVMLFQGFSIETKGFHVNTWYMRGMHKIARRLGVNMEAFQRNSPWRGHPYNVNNNVNQINGDPLNTGAGRDVHTLRLPHVTKLQEEYVKKVIDAVGDLDNVLWEISNESNCDSTEWQYHMIDFIHKYEETKSKKHPVLMTAHWGECPGGMNNILFRSRAEAISPNDEGGYKDDPPVAQGKKVILSDTDHLWGTGGNSRWVWKSFLRGLNPIFMDPYQLNALQYDPDKPEWQGIRKSMGLTLALANKMNLVAMSPQPILASSRYCLSEKGKEYLVYTERMGEIVVNLTDASGELNIEWLDPSSGESIDGGTTIGGSMRSFIPPFSGEAVLYIKARSKNSRKKISDFFK
jgi:hypothetical protein